jgi:hypothetical protein
LERQGCDPHRAASEGEGLPGQRSQKGVGALLELTAASAAATGSCSVTTSAEIMILTAVVREATAAPNTSGEGRYPSGEP